VTLHRDRGQIGDGFQDGADLGIYRLSCASARTPSTVSVPPRVMISGGYAQLGPPGLTGVTS
jgi:hypothetical protein